LFFSLLGGSEGVCRAGRPSVISFVKGEKGELWTDVETVWPEVSDGDWCGEFSKAEVEDEYE
jgi:hypothetical protein